MSQNQGALSQVFAQHEKKKQQQARVSSAQSWRPNQREIDQYISMHYAGRDSSDYGVRHNAEQELRRQRQNEAANPPSPVVWGSCGYGRESGERDWSLSLFGVMCHPGARKVCCEACFCRWCVIGKINDTAIYIGELDYLGDFDQVKYRPWPPEKVTKEYQENAGQCVDKDKACLGTLICDLCLLGGPVCASLAYSQAREKARVRGKNYIDCLKASFCTPCAMAQAAHELAIHEDEIGEKFVTGKGPFFPVGLYCSSQKDFEIAPRPQEMGGGDCETKNEPMSASA